MILETGPDLEWAPTEMIRAFIESTDDSWVWEVTVTSGETFAGYIVHLDTASGLYGISANADGCLHLSGTPYGIEVTIAWDDVERVVLA